MLSGSVAAGMPLSVGLLQRSSSSSLLASSSSAEDFWVLRVRSTPLGCSCMCCCSSARRFCFLGGDAWSLSESLDVSWLACVLDPDVCLLGLATCMASWRQVLMLLGSGAMSGTSEYCLYSAPAFFPPLLGCPASFAWAGWLCFFLPEPSLLLLCASGQLACLEASTSDPAMMTPHRGGHWHQLCACMRTTTPRQLLMWVMTMDILVAETFIDIGTLALCQSAFSIKCSCICCISFSVLMLTDQPHAFMGTLRDACTGRSRRQ